MVHNFQIDSQTCTSFSGKSNIQQRKDLTFRQVHSILLQYFFLQYFFLLLLAVIAHLHFFGQGLIILTHLNVCPMLFHWIHSSHIFLILLSTGPVRLEISTLDFVEYFNLCICSYAAAFLALYSDQVVLIFFVLKLYLQLCYCKCAKHLCRTHYDKHFYPFSSLPPPCTPLTSGASTLPFLPRFSHTLLLQTKICVLCLKQVCYCRSSLLPHFQHNALTFVYQGCGQL